MYRPGDADRQVDAVTGASPFARHDEAPQVEINDQIREGETLFQENCAFCHAADGTGKNWIGSFLQPHPRDLTSDRARMTRERLVEVITHGIEGTTMSAWGKVLAAGQIEAIAAYVEEAFFRDGPGHLQEATDRLP